MPQEFKTKSGKTYSLDPNKTLNDSEFMQMVQDMDAEELDKYTKLLHDSKNSPTTPKDITLNIGGKHVILGGKPDLPGVFGNDLARRALWGVGGAGVGTLTGGPWNGAVQGISNFISPPESEGDIVGQVINSIPGIKYLDKARILSNGAGTRFGRNFATGAGQYLAGEAGRQLIDNQNVEMNLPSLIGATATGATSGLLGETAHKTKTSSTVLEGNARRSIENQLPIFLDRPVTIQEFSQLTNNDSAPLRQLFSGPAAARQAELDVMENQRKLSTLKLRENVTAQRKINRMLSSQKDAMDVADDRLATAQINMKKDMNVAKLNIRGIKEWNIDPASGKSFNDLVPLKIPTEVETINNLIQAEYSPKQAEQMLSFYNGLRAAEGESFHVKDYIEAIRSNGYPKLANQLDKALTNAPRQAMLEQAAQIRQLKQAAIKTHEDQIAKLQNDMLNTDIQRYYTQSKAATGVASDPALKAAYNNSQTAKNRALDLGVDIVKERNDLANIKDAIAAKKKEKIFSTPALNTILKSDGSGPITDEVLTKNITGASQETLRDAMRDLSGNPDAQKALRNTYLTNIFRQSYDHKLDIFDWAALSSKTDTSKLQEVFGGGTVGANMAQNFNDFMAGVKELDTLAQGNAKLRQASTGMRVGRAGMAGIVGLLPTGLLFHFPGSGAVAAAGAGGLVNLAFNQKLIDYLAARPTFGKQFLKWAQEGGSQSALAAYPVVHKFFADNLKGEE